MAAKAVPTFEKAIKDLEKIVGQLESSDLPLEKALEKFEAGMKLSKYCANVLDEAEKRVNLLMIDETGGVREEPFERES